MSEPTPCCSDVDCKRCKGLGVVITVVPVGECRGYGYDAHKKWYSGMPMTGGLRFIRWIKGKGQ